MRAFTKRYLPGLAAAVAAIVLTSSATAQNVVVLRFDGSFDSGYGNGANLAGTGYSAAFVLGTSPSSVFPGSYSIDPLNRTAEFGYRRNYRSAFRTENGTMLYDQSDGNIVTLRDDYNFNGAGYFGSILSAGTYDVVSILGRSFSNAPPSNPAGCTGAPPGEGDDDCLPLGAYASHELILIGSSGMFSGLTAPLFDRINFSEVIYGTYEVTSFLDGVVQGGAFQDPPLTYSNNLFSGAGMTGTLELAPDPVPEPTTWAMMIVGFGLAGGVLRFRWMKPTLA